MVPRPIKNCYWVVPERLLAGEYPRDPDEASSALKMNALLAAGVRAFIDLTEERDGLFPYTPYLGEARRYSFPIRDFSVPSSPSFTSSILDAVDERMGLGDIVYVHCWGGIGRTGLIIGCWLARHGDEGDRALSRLKELWAHCPKSSREGSPQTNEQSRYILGWRKGQ